MITFNIRLFFHMPSEQFLEYIGTVLQLIIFKFTLIHKDIHQRNVKKNKEFQ